MHCWVFTAEGWLRLTQNSEWMCHVSATMSVGHRCVIVSGQRRGCTED